MPIYEYCCDDCAHEFETMQKISEEPLKTCPSCGMDTLRKKVSAAGFRLKGAGWYETDFKKGGDKKRNLEGGAAGSDSSPSATASTGTSTSSSDSSSSTSSSASSSSGTGSTSGSGPSSS